MKIDFKWNRTAGQIAERVTGGDSGQLFLANEAKRLMDPYVPADELVLAQNVQTYVEKGRGIVHYQSPYAHYQYVGLCYSTRAGDGQSIGIGTAAGRKLKHSTFRHPLATSEWDKAMMTARGRDLAKAMERYLKGR